MIVLRLALLFVAAVAVLPNPAVAASDLTTPDEVKARKLYNLKCAKCHKFYHPAKYSRDDWEV